MASILKQLSDLIAASVHDIDAACDARGIPFPSLDEPFSEESERARQEQEVLSSIGIIVAAATQLIAVARVPSNYLLSMVLQHTIPACLGAANDGHVAEILREAGPQGAHVNDIAERNGMNAARIGRVLRLLATHHIFREVTPDVFTNNRVSSLLDTGKPVEELLKFPLIKHDGTSGFSAAVGHQSDETFKHVAALSETLHDPVFGHSDEPNQCARSKAFNTDLSAFEWLELPENSYRRRRFGVFMDGLSKVQLLDTSWSGFDFSSLPDGGLVVDVAGGIGSVSMVIAKAYPKLNIVVEDLPEVVRDAEKFWKANLAESFDSGRVRLVPHDMFTPQPEALRAPDLFVLRGILHDWSDTYAMKILKHLRAAAGPRTQLLIIDSVLRYACPPDPQRTETFKVPKLVEPPAPLLANMGGAASLHYAYDIVMLALQNGQERTADQFNELLRRAGWELKEIKKPDSTGAWLPHVVAAPL
ncbi:hypothetical protein HETIRDRAFT_154964 [Heterobasidion irregulare TC 32-1]|uniref:Uncharacterized protein n=1 Tax=Heterobasidion irregulare (strain TC 32-1) TaxID=747525 RepID=W4K765_HETIT|nr:uncharacterized protein HETIRDRAFT_154964 [Heterobasidion irregulare TC 32-1]ETW80891.1 hypothetical protein HETIRDRAFT_154964 [Heterobasidion irregulare TC 32-1]